jgi:hypothetical protein
VNASVGGVCPESSTVVPLADAAHAGAQVSGHSTAVDYRAVDT